MGAAEFKISESSNNLQLRCPFYFLKPLEKKALDSFDHPRSDALPSSSAKQMQCPGVTLCLRPPGHPLTLLCFFLILPPTHAPLHITGEFHLFAFYEWNHESNSNTVCTFLSCFLCSKLFARFIDVLAYSCGPFPCIIPHHVLSTYCN